jgi:23S rRNA pseudouridine2605 synthase
VTIKNFPQPASARPEVARHGVARVISKLGLGSRTQAAEWVRQGRVRVNGNRVSDPDHPVRLGRDAVEIDGMGAARPAERLVLMLNKPRGLVSSANDERGRDTVYSCFEGSALPWVAPAGRLDKASEGLLLFSNDPVWNASITDPEQGLHKTYHVQINRVPDAGLLKQLMQGASVDEEFLRATRVELLRAGGKNAWLLIQLDEGRNRQIRRLLSAFDVQVLRLVRVAIGSLELGKLGKGQWRRLTADELQAFDD